MLAWKQSGVLFTKTVIDTPPDSVVEADRIMIEALNRCTELGVRVCFEFEHCPRVDLKGCKLSYILEVPDRD